MRSSNRVVSTAFAALAVAYQPASSQEIKDPVPPAAEAEYLRNYGLAEISAFPAYELGFTGKGVSVAVVDGGIDATHPEFAGRISPESRNFISDRGPDDFTPDILRDGSREGHATHVTGIIGAARDGVGMQGVAYDATLVSLRAIGGHPEVDGDVPEDFNAISYAAKMKYGVLNGSYGLPVLSKMIVDPDDDTRVIPNPNWVELDYTPLYYGPDGMKEQYDRLKQAVDADVVLVFAAGNDADDQPTAAQMPTGPGATGAITPEATRSGVYRFINVDDDLDLQDPRTYKFYAADDSEVADLDFSDIQDAVINVVAVGKDHSIGEYSNRCGALLADWCLAAPGGDENGVTGDADEIYSTYPGNNYAYEEGTSMASPHVAGAAAVLREAFPYMTARQIIETLLTTATDLGSPEIYGQGLLNLGAAVGGPMEFRAPVFDVDTKGYSSLWSNPITGVGGLTKRGAGLLTLTADSDYAGPTRVLGGTLGLDGTVASDVAVSESGTLVGVGGMGALTLLGNGRVAPGSATDPDQQLASLTIGGDLRQGSGTVYQAGIAGSASDRLVVAGTATIEDGAAIEVVSSAASAPSIGQSYAVLTAAGGVSGEYSALSGDIVTGTPFLDFELDYGPTTVLLDVDRSAVAFADVARTSNQRAVAEGIESLDAGDPVQEGILYGSAEEARAAFSALSGEIHASIASASIENSGMLRAVVINRLSYPGAGTADPTPSMLLGADFEASQLPRAVWGTVIGSWGHLDGDGNAATLDQDTQGFLIGADAPVGDVWRIGVFGGYSSTSFDVDSRASSGSSDNYHAGVYGGANWGPIALRTGATYSLQKVETQRRVAYADVNEKIDADYDAHSTQVFGELGYTIESGELALQPFAGLSYVNVTTDSFDESGGASALQSDGGDSDATMGTIGFQADGSISSQNGTLFNLRGVFGLRHAFSGTDTDFAMSFDGGDRFAVAGAPIAENAFVINTGVGVVLTPVASASLSYVGQLASGSEAHSIVAEVSVAF